MEEYQYTKKNKSESISPIDVLDSDVWSILALYMYDSYKNTIVHPKSIKNIYKDIPKRPELPLLKREVHYRYIDSIYMDDSDPHEFGITLYAKFQHEDSSLHRLKYFCHTRCNLMLVCKKFCSIFANTKFDECLWVTNRTMKKLRQKGPKVTALFESILPQITLTTSPTCSLFKKGRIKGVIYSHLDYYEFKKAEKLQQERHELSFSISELLKDVGLSDIASNGMKSIESMDLSAFCLPLNLLRIVFLSSECRRIVINSTTLNFPQIEEVLSLIKPLEEMRIYMNTTILGTSIPPSVKKLEMCYYYRKDDKELTYPELCIPKSLLYLNGRRFDVIRLDVRPPPHTHKSTYGYMYQLMIEGVNTRRLEIRYDDTNYHYLWKTESTQCDEVLFEFDMTDINLGYNQYHKDAFDQNERSYTNAFKLCNQTRFKKVIFSIKDNYRIGNMTLLNDFLLNCDAETTHVELRLSNAPIRILNTQLLEEDTVAKWSKITQRIRESYDFRKPNGDIITMCYAELVATR
jgi:hypothetical protein